MFYEDHFDPAAENDVVSVEQKVIKKSVAAEAASVDNYYTKYTISLNKKWTDGKYYKNVTIEIYGSGQTGSRIRNAVSGQRYNFLVGSVDEDLFFKVTDSRAHYGRKEALHLYYDTPEQYENHHFTTVSQNVKNSWNDKHMMAMKRVL